MPDATTLSDPASRWQPDGVDGPSAIVSVDYPWTNANWEEGEHHQLIIDELHIGTITTPGKF